MKQFYLFILFVISAHFLTAQNQIDRPNVVWIVTEDNSRNFLKLYDKSGASTPQIEKLAAQGVVFDRAFSNAPVCSVARSTIISGCYAPRIGAQYHRRTKLAPMPEGLEMFPSYLRKAGYYTTNNSKEDYNLVKSAEVWDESSKKASFRNRAAGQPFFHVQNFGTTHEGQLHFSETLMDTQTTKHDPEQVKVFPYHPNTPLFRYTYAKYLDLHQRVDQSIAEFIQQLEEDGLMENTFIFYYGDHGGVLPRSKGYIYESGLHIPLVVYIPEKWRHLSPFETGSRSDAFVEFIDLGPTVLQLAGIEVPKAMDGSPFLGKNISQESLSERLSAFAYADRFDEKYDLVRSIRSGKYKYIRNYQPFNIDGLYNFYRYKMLAYQEWRKHYHQGKLNDIQQQFFKARVPEALYDIEKDPHEVHNLAKNPANQLILRQLREELQKRVKSMPDLSFYPEPYFLEEGLDNPVQFGQSHKEEIAKLIDIADLSLLSFNKARNGIKTALNSSNSWERYWGLIVCSSFGEQASGFYKKAEQLQMSDTAVLVRCRAAEFLSLSKKQLKPIIWFDILKNAQSETEANLILNSLALLKDLDEDFNIEIPEEVLNPVWIKSKKAVINRRLEYLDTP